MVRGDGGSGYTVIFLIWPATVDFEYGTKVYSINFQPQKLGPRIMQLV